MKRYLLSAVLLLLPFIGMCQNAINEIWTQPAIFKADEQVTLFFDVKGTQLETETDAIYLWSWFPSEPDAGNWANSSDFAKLTHVEGTVWKITMVPSDYYHVAADQIVSLYGLLKTKDGSKVSDAFAPDKGNAINLYNFTDIKNTKISDFYPKTIKGDRPFSILINAGKTWSDCATNATQGALATASEVHMHSGLNDWKVIVENNPANLAKTKLTHLGDNIYRMDMIPWEYYGQEIAITKVNAVFANDTWSKLGFDTNCADFLFNSTGIVVVTPSYNLFPQKITKKDILTLVAVNGDLDASDLNYEVTMGTTKVTGKFEGIKPNYRAYIDLVTPLKEQNVDKIHVTIKTNSGANLLDTDMALTPIVN
ncbi:hypothetical protein NF867_03840 [Solitalea sp. MAHUQ-68]|uniref:Uncharacterized protein n=1 Tax=Solitalea agri TaxID=2953739 RepID=A0A9X2EZM2_9SPHI|nr:hypothetical protein [Solitalea agri]MCO4291992.1 hypothetical protein [Solitalea agri]